MKRLLLLALLFALLMLSSASLVSARDINYGVSIPTHIIVFKSGVNAINTANSLAANYGLKITNVYSSALNGVAAIIPSTRMSALQRDSRIAYIERNQVFTIAAQTTPTGITRSYAASNPNLRINGVDDFRVNVDVAVIDTGIASHPDLNIAGHVNCVSNNPFRASCSSGGTDGNGHGTHVAGTIGAIDNGTGVVGIAPGARLWGVRVLNNSGSGYTNQIIAGIDWVAANSATIEVANMSLGCECTSSAQATAISNAIARGVVFVVAAGNSDKNASTFSPANHPDVVTVSALADFNGLPGGGAAPTCRQDEDDTLANFSNWGSLVEIAAPGVCINSTWLNGGYNTISGTSMASPHVAGAAAVIIATSGKPTTRTGVLNVRSTLINTGNYNWTDDSGDGIKEPLLDMSNTTVYNPK
jgi:subtilisin family serine protease